MKKKLLLFPLLVILLLGGFALYVGLSVRSELNAARSILGTASQDLSADDVLEGRKHLEAAEDILADPPAALLRLIPVARQNIQAVDAVVNAGLPVMDDALALIEAREVVGERELVHAGRVRLEALDELGESLERQLKSLRVLESELVSHRTGWLVPPLWNEVDDLAKRAEELRSSVESATKVLEVAPALLGQESRRTYLVTLLNNAELRGAGGILSGLGTITARSGRLTLGPFSYYGDLSTKPPEPVPAPEDFERRFSRYGANTTTVVNASTSPDIPEVAIVAARLFEKLRGRKVDGALLIDPRGISSLMPDDAERSVGGSDLVLTNENLADFIYSDSYDLLGGADPGRRSAILTAGRAAFRTILEGRSRRSDVLDSASAAVAGGHIRFVSFHENEKNILDGLGVSADLTTNSVDSLLISVQNLGADKLDYWMRRHVEHKCSIPERSLAHCESVVVLSNETPRGLNDYVTQMGHRIKRSYRYGVYLGFLEVYVPEAAGLTSVTLNGQPATFFPESEDGRKSLGMYFSTPRGQRTTVRVSYDLNLPESGYSLEITPQPLAFDATLEVDISGPMNWSKTGPGRQSDGLIELRGELDKVLHWELRPSKRTGIPAVWRTLVDFWTQPLG